MPSSGKMSRTRRAVDGFERLASAVWNMRLPSEYPAFVIHKLPEVYARNLEMFANVRNTSADCGFGFLCHNCTSSSLCLRNEKWVRELFSRFAFPILKVLLEMTYSEYAGHELYLFRSGVREQVLVNHCPIVCEFGFPAISQLS